MNQNIVIIAGRLGKKPETKKTQSGSSVCEFSIATNRKWKDKDGNKKEETDWNNVTAFGKTADNIATYFNVGDEIFIFGRLKNDSWEDKAGTKHYKTSVIAERFDFGAKARINTEGTQKPARQEEDIPVVEEIEVSQIPF